MSNAILHVTIRGRVQGVGYRAWVEDRARASRLEGWVRNRRDGSVEAVVQGPRDAVDAIIRWARRGPAAAEVEEVEVSDMDEAVPALFETRPTA